MKIEPGNAKIKIESEVIILKPECSLTCRMIKSSCKANDIDNTFKTIGHKLLCYRDKKSLTSPTDYEIKTLTK